MKFACLLLALGSYSTCFAQTASSDAYLSWSKSKAEAVGKSMQAAGRVGSMFTSRGLKTDRAINYKLKATWMTPEVIRASARIAQLQSRLSDEATRALVAEAESAGKIVVMIELHANEGSGVIPQEWEAFFGPKENKEIRPVKGRQEPKLRDVRALSSSLRHDYAYERFWVVFPVKTENGSSLFSRNNEQAQLTVRIHDQEGHVTWRIPDSISEKVK